MKKNPSPTNAIGSECILFTYCVEDLLMAWKRSNCSEEAFNLLNVRIHTHSFDVKIF